ncbi:MAG: penicillin-binding transpeptidase domain-containing protein [Acutalibacter sp.]
MPKITKIGRSAACILLVLAVFAIYELRLVQWQIIDGEKYEEISLSNRTDSIQIEAARGEILDRNGNVLAGNRSSYNIVYDALEMDYSARNATILQVLDLLEEREEEWRDRLPIVLGEDGTYQYAEDSDSEIESLKETLSLAEYATAEDCMAELTRQYDCQGYSREDARNVVSVRYSMTRDGFSRTNPYVIAEDVSAETVAVISERSQEWPGIEARVAVARYYGEDGTLAPHVVGYTGAIRDYQYEQAVEDGTAYDSEDNISGYKWTDTRGQSGIESAFEEELRGQRGEETIYTNASGEVESTSVTTTPKEGNTVYTTLDSDLQRVANLSLAKNIEGNTDAKDCTAGAVVVLDVEDFGVLACSSYPTFDMNQYRSDNDYVNLLAEDESQPLFNRALQGVFAPGSVFKPVVALAALQEGVISAATSVYCPGYYELADLKLACTCGMGNYRNVYSALAHSCNTFFCDTGYHLGIDTLGPYAEYFGVGTTTGVELGEATGTMSNRQEYRENHGVEWTDGVTAQASIGQADDMFTPIQLATMCATIANGGVRLQTHFLDKVTDYTGETVVKEYEPVELYDAGLSSAVLGVVQTGMQMVATEGTAASVFANYPVAIACKTGTAETSDPSVAESKRTEPNLSFICYAPANDPQIAIAVMMEYGNKGDYAKNVAKDILDEYFGFYTWDEDGNKYDQAGNQVDDDGKVIKTAEEVEEEKAAQEAAENQASQSQTSGESSSSTDETAATPTPAPSPTPDRGSDIPNTIFNGESSSSSSSEENSTSSSGDGGDDGNGSSQDSTSSSSGVLDGPYYKGETSSG